LIVEISSATLNPRKASSKGIEAVQKTGTI